jgi:hypothetical protein
MAATAADFLLKRIGQNTALPGALNTITITLALTRTLRGANKAALIFRGLTGAATADLTSMPLSDIDCATYTGACASTIFNTSAVSWNRAAGNLLLPVATGQSLTAGMTYMFAFVLMPNGISPRCLIMIGHATLSLTAR